MLEPYPVFTIEPAWVLEPEAMGSKRKFWYRAPAPNHGNWLFKYPQPNTGQHWAEKVAAEVAACLSIHHARVELAVIQGERGSATESFARDRRELIHGNQILAGVVLGYDATATFRHSRHSLGNIWNALERVFVSPDAARRAKQVLAGYLVLDAVIGNTDRHHENWGVLRRQVGDRLRGFLAPSFDHASSLGRELLDERRARYLRDGRVGHYSENGHGGIYWSESGRRGPSPLDLVRYAVAEHRPMFLPALQGLARLTLDAVRDIVQRVPDDWMSPTAREFTTTLLRYNVQELQRLIP